MRKLKKILITFLILIINLSVFYFPSYAAMSQDPVVKVEEISTYAPVCLLMDSQTGKIIYDKNIYKRMYPASTTKIMTAILTLENCNLTDTATASYDAVYSVPYDYSNANIQVGEQLTINQLLNVLLIASANEAANVLAEHVAGSVSSFAAMMNAKADEIGCKDTHFVNANGMHNENHYSTAYDLALIAKYAMQNETFRKIVSTSTYTLPATNKFATNDRVFKNTNELILKDDSDRVDNYYYQYATGIKTGYTSLAKNCLVASGKKDDKEYIAVILGAETTDNGLAVRYLDSKTLFDYAFENICSKTLYEANSVLKTIKVKGATLTTRNLDVLIEDEISVVTKKNVDLNSIIPTVEFKEDLKAPLSANSVIGKITYDVDGVTYTSDLLAANDVKESTLLNKLLFALAIFSILFVLYKLTTPSNKKKNKKKSKRKKESSDRNYIYW